MGDGRWAAGDGGRPFGAAHEAYRSQARRGPGNRGVAGDFARIDSLIVDVATRRITSEDSVTARAVTFDGVRDPGTRWAG